MEQGTSSSNATAYVVLRREAGSSPSSGPVWVELGEADAANGKAAVAQVAQASGAYVAIPKRSFGEVRVEVETQPRVRIVG
jgi:hypothetical protein